MFSRVPNPDVFDENKRLLAHIYELQRLLKDAADIFEDDAFSNVDSDGKPVICPRRLGRWLGKYDVLCSDLE